MYSLRAQFISKQSAAIITLSPPPSAVTGFWLLSAGIISGMCHSLFTGASSDNICGYKNNTLHQMLLNRSTLKEEPRCTFRPQIKHLAWERYIFYHQQRTHEKHQWCHLNIIEHQTGLKYPQAGLKWHKSDNSVGSYNCMLIKPRLSIKRLWNNTSWEKCFQQYNWLDLTRQVWRVAD